MSAFGSDLSLIHEVLVTGRKVGATNRFWATLAHNENVFRRTVEFVMSSLGFSLKPEFDFDLSQASYRAMRQDHPDKEGDFTVRLVAVHADNEGPIAGSEFFKRANAQNEMGGQRHLEAMLREEAKIPVDYRKFKLAAPGTIWDSVGGPIVTLLEWNEERKHWLLGKEFLDNAFDNRFRLVQIIR